MTTQHMQGEWKIEHLGKYGKVIEVVCGDQAIAQVFGEANARLIAAAPKLLEALEELVSSADMYRRSVNQRGDGRASNEASNMLSAHTLMAQKAIAAAKGE